MNIAIGRKIHELRRLNHKKQEDLAAALGVTGQAVSRWENGGSYPDLELLPPIANFFGVTVDELFGYQGDRQRKIEEHFAKIQAMNRENNGTDVSMDACVLLARESLAEFPEEPRLIYALASVLYNAGYVRRGEYHLTDGDGYDVYDTRRHREYPEWQEAIRLYEKALERLENGPTRDRAVRELTQLYLSTGEPEKADAVVSTCPEMDACRELLRINSCDGRERARRYGEAILTTADRLARLMIEGVMASEAHLSPRERAESVRNALSAYALVCPDGNYGVYHGAAAKINLYLSEHLWLSCDGDGAFAALDEALRHAERLDELGCQGDVAYTSPLVILIFN